MAIVTDALGLEFDSKSNYERVISLSPSISELLYDLDLDTKLVALTQNCDAPKYLRESKSIVLDNDVLDFSKIEELKVDLIILSNDDNVVVDIESLKKYAEVFVVDVRDVESNKKLILDLGILFKKRNDATKIVLKIDKQLEDLANITEGLLIRKGIYFIWNDPWVAVGKDTYVNSLLDLLNVYNPFVQLKERFPGITPANIKLAHTDIVILPNDEPFAFQEEDAIAIASNTHDASLFFVEGKMFSRFGSRLIKSLDYLKLLALKFKEMA